MNTSLHTPTNPQTPRSMDFRENIQRQTSEQKSLGRILTLISVSIAAFIILSFSMAGYGGYVIWKRLNEQSSTIADVENKFTTRISNLQANIDRLQTQIYKTHKFSEEVARQNQELARAIREQQELARRTKAQADTLSNQIRQEKLLREQQIQELYRYINANRSSTISPQRR